MTTRERWNKEASTLVGRTITGAQYMSGREAEADRSSPRRVRFDFNTAWSPPFAVVNTLAGKWPGLAFRLNWWECGMGYRGVYLWDGGELSGEATHEYRGRRGG